MEIKNILWAYDCSDESKHALSYAEHFAKLFNAKIYGIHVYSVSLPINPYYAPYLYDMAERIEKKYREEFKQIDELLRKKGIDFEGVVLKGGISDEITRFAEEKNIDMTVMGITPRGLIGSMFMESTSIAVLRKTKKPLLVTKGKKQKEKIELKKILVPVDIGDKIKDAIITAFSIAEKENSHITFVYVLNIAFQIYEIPEKIISEIIEEASNNLKDYVNTVSEEAGIDKEKRDINFITKIIFGMNAAPKIVDYANRNDFDMIVINSHGGGTLKRLFLGSTAEQVAREAICPVLVVKPSISKE